MQAPERHWEALGRRLESLGLREADLEEQFVLGSGKGGQKVNRSASAVRLTHVPSGRTVRAEGERSQYLNRVRARERLCEEVEGEREERRRERGARRAAARYRRRKPGKRQQAARLEGKKRRGELKRRRGRPSREE